MLNASLGGIGIKHASGLDASSEAAAFDVASSSATASWGDVALTICFVTLNIITIVSADHQRATSMYVEQKIENEPIHRR